ncbi:MAG: LuxE/PaaK family acyltransferase [bacterium JZ-2024 1]
MNLLSLKKKISTAIRRGYENPISEEEFNQLCLEVFSLQFVLNPVYGTFCKKLGVHPQKIHSWQEIPPLPAVAFKEKTVRIRNTRGGKVSSPPIIFHSSGTTWGKAHRSRVSLLFPDLYILSAKINAKRWLFPDVDTIPLCFLFPSWEERRDSSLAFMFWIMEKEFGSTGKTAYFVTRKGFHCENLLFVLKRLEEQGEKVALLGPTSFHLYFLDYLKGKKERMRLPPGSRIMDTGGSKGVPGEITRKEFYEKVHTFLGIPENYVVNEYGMCELSGFYFDNVLCHHISLQKVSERYKVVPPWMRVRVVDPENFTPAQQGILLHYDLSNLGTVVAIETEDIGEWKNEGFEILGRTDFSDVRGCSLLLREYLLRNR